MILLDKHIRSNSRKDSKRRKVRYTPDISDKVDNSVEFVGLKMDEKVKPMIPIIAY